MNEEFYVGQIFENTYKPEAAVWCNENNCFIEELPPADGKRRYIIREVPAPSEQELAVQEIVNLKSRLAETDYVVTKIAEGVATKEEYADILENRAEWRKKINELETSLASNESDLKA